MVVKYSISDDDGTINNDLDWVSTFLSNEGRSYISDHCFVYMLFDVSKPSEIKTLIFCKLNEINIDSFKDDLLESYLITNDLSY